MRRSSTELRRLHSSIPPEAASIPAKNRLGSTKNSLKKQGRCCEKRDLFALKTVTFFARFSQQLISKKQGTAASEPPNNLRFLIKKKRRTRRRKRSKNLKMHILFISILSASELSEARIALPFAIADDLCLPHTAAPPLDCDRAIFLQGACQRSGGCRRCEGVPGTFRIRHCRTDHRGQ